jgi:hypothetical protein
VGSPTDREVHGDGVAAVVRAEESSVHGEGRQVFRYSEREASEMRNAATVLNIIREREKRALGMNHWRAV